MIRSKKTKLVKYTQRQTEPSKFGRSVVIAEPCLATGPTVGQFPGRACRPSPGPSTLPPLAVTRDVDRPIQHAISWVDRTEQLLPMVQPNSWILVAATMTSVEMHPPPTKDPNPGGPTHLLPPLVNVTRPLHSKPSTTPEVERGSCVPRRRTTYYSCPCLIPAVFARWSYSVDGEELWGATRVYPTENTRTLAFFFEGRSIDFPTIAGFHSYTSGVYHDTSGLRGDHHVDDICGLRFETLACTALPRGCVSKQTRLQRPLVDRHHHSGMDIIKQLGHGITPEDLTHMCSKCRFSPSKRSTQPGRTKASSRRTAFSITDNVSSDERPLISPVALPRTSQRARRSRGGKRCQ